MPVVKLQSSDNIIFDVDIKIVKQLGTINDMVNDLYHEDVEVSIVPIRNVSSKILSLVLQWADYHKNDPTDDERMHQSDDGPIWDADFLRIDKGR